jgi:hypothetical protein
VAPSAQRRSRLPLRSQRPDEGGLENSAASEARPCPPFLLFACYLQAGRSGPVAGAVGHPQASRPARRIPAREPPARIKVIKIEPANGEPGARSTRVRREGRGQSLRGRASQESRHQLFFSKRATPNGVSPAPRSQGKKVRGIRTRLAARIDSAIEARDSASQSYVCAKTPLRPERGRNPDSPGDAQSTAELRKSPTSSGPIPWGPVRSCGLLRSRSPRR